MTVRAPSEGEKPAAIFTGTGDIVARLNALPAADTPLGAVGGWSQALRNAVELILPAGAQIVMFWGPAFVALYNDAYAPTIGDKHPRALGRPASEGWAELWDDLRPLLVNVRETGKTFADRDRAFYIERHGYGETVYFDISYSAVRDDDGSVGGVLCIVSETTDRVRATLHIEEDRARLASMFDKAPSFMAVLRQPGHIFELTNAAYLDLIGRRDVIGLSIHEALPEVTSQGFVAILDQVAATGRAFTASGTRVLLERGQGADNERFVDFVLQPITDRHGAVTSIFVEGYDITDRVRAQERLVINEETLRLATTAAEIGTWDRDVVTGTLNWSDRTKAMFGIAPGTPCSIRDWEARVHPDDLARVLAAMGAALDPDRRALYDVEYRAVSTVDGSERWLASKGRGIFEGGRCIRAVGTILDVTDRKAAEEALRESERRFRTMADSAPALIWVTNAAGEVVFANRWYERVFGRPAAEMLGHGWRSVLHPDDAPAAVAAALSAAEMRAPLSADVRFIDARGRTRWFHVEGRPRLVDGEFAGYVGCNSDTTDVHEASLALEAGIAARTAELAAANTALRQQIAERERVEETLAQMQRLEAIGQLTSGVAHDFNNLLTVIMGNAEIVEKLGQRTGLEPKTLGRIGHIRTAAERGAALTAQLLAFSRRQRLEARPTDLNETITGMGGLLQGSLGNAITVEADLADDLWYALVDRTQVELVVLNLAINGRDAMAVGGTLRIATRNAVMGPPARPEHPPAGEHVMIAVSDTGTGMTPEVLARVFEPFFTTKDVGKGSGLGLAQAFGFAKQSGGGVCIDTVAGEGTTVRVYLPRTAPPADPMPVEPVEAEAVRSVEGAVVLVVDDDDRVRRVTVDGVAALGCTVLEAASGPAALDLIETRRDVALVIADFAMPGMTGAQLAAEVRRRWPATAFLVVTGYAELDAIADVPKDAIVQKPYRAADLQARVRRALGDPRHDMKETA